MHASPAHASAHINYTKQFKVFTAAVFANIAIWFLVYIFISRPTLQENYEMQVAKKGAYHGRFSRFRIDYANGLLVYMCLFLCLRAVHFVPAISRRLLVGWNSVPTSYL